MIARLPVSHSPSLFPSSRLGLVSVPKTDPALSASATEVDFDADRVRDLLGELGRNLGMALLTAKAEDFPETDAAEDADEAREGRKAGGPPPAIPIFPDEAFRKTLEGLDAVWMRGGDVVAVFAVEDGTGRREGPRRLADLLALHPKLKAALYVVSLPHFKSGLVEEINRPIYHLLKNPLGEAVRLLDWNRLEAEVRELGDRVRYLKAEFLEGISDVVEPPSAA